MFLAHKYMKYGSILIANELYFFYNEPQRLRLWAFGGTVVLYVSFVGAFAVMERQCECGRKTGGMHSLSRLVGVSQPISHNRVLSNRALVL